MKLLQNVIIEGGKYANIQVSMSIKTGIIWSTIKQ